jgi:hypothetical protein
MLGRLAATIAKTKKHPEKVLVNKYCMLVAVSTLSPLAADEESHPLVPLGAVLDSGIERVVGWPQRNRNNCKALCCPEGDEASRLLLHWLGQAVFEQYCNVRPHSFTLLQFKTAVHIGRWKFNIKLRENGLQTERTRSSWFCMRARHVPHFNHSAALELTDGDELVYGRIERFAELMVVAWSRRFFLAEVSALYRSSTRQLHTDYPLIDLTQPLLTRTHEGDFASVEEQEQYNQRPLQQRLIPYVLAEHIEDMIAVAPREIPAGDHYVVLPLGV